MQAYNAHVNVCLVIRNPFLYANSKDADQTAFADPESFDRGDSPLTSFFYYYYYH